MKWTIFLQCYIAIHFFLLSISCSEENKVVRVERYEEGDHIFVDNKEECLRFRNVKYEDGQCYCKMDDIFHEKKGKLGCYAQEDLGGNMTPTFASLFHGFMFNVEPLKGDMGNYCVDRKRKSITMESTSNTYLPSPHPPGTSVHRPGKENDIKMWFWDFSEEKFIEVEEEWLQDDLKQMVKIKELIKYQGIVIMLQLHCRGINQFMYLKVPGITSYKISEDSLVGPQEGSVKDFVLKTVVGTISALIVIIALVISFACLKKKGYLTKNEIENTSNIEKGIPPPSVIEPVYVEPEYEYISQVLSAVKQNALTRSGSNNSTAQSMRSNASPYQQLRLEDIQVATTLYHMLRQENVEQKTQEPTYDTSAKIAEYIRNNERRNTINTNEEECRQTSSQYKSSMQSSPPFPGTRYENLEGEEIRGRSVSYHKDGDAIDYSFHLPPPFSVTGYENYEVKDGRDAAVKTGPIQEDHNDIAMKPSFQETRYENVEDGDEIPKKTEFKCTNSCSPVPIQKVENQYQVSLRCTERCEAACTTSIKKTDDRSYENMPETDRKSSKSYQNMPEALSTLNSTKPIKNITEPKAIENPVYTKKTDKSSSIYKRSVSKEPILSADDEIDSENFTEC